MSTQRSTFAKRRREMDLKDKARAKIERRAAKRTETRSTKGPPIAWDAVSEADTTSPTDTIDASLDNTLDSELEAQSPQAAASDSEA